MADDEVFHTPFPVPTADAGYRVSSSHELCEKCQEIFFANRLDASYLNVSGQHHSNALELKESASRGCQLCLFVWTRENIISQDRISEKPDETKAKIPIRWTLGGFPKGTYTDWFIEFYPVGEMNLTIYLNKLKAKHSRTCRPAIRLTQSRSFTPVAEREW